MRKATKVLVLTLTTPLVATVLLNNPAQYVHWSDRAKSMTLLMDFPWGEPCETHHVELETDGKRFHYTSEDYTPLASAMTHHGCLPASGGTNLRVKLTGTLLVRSHCKIVSLILLQPRG